MTIINASIGINNISYKINAMLILNHQSDRNAK